MAAVRIIVFVCWTTHEGSVVVQRRCHNLTLMRFVRFDFLLFKLLVSLAGKSFSRSIHFWSIFGSSALQTHKKARHWLISRVLIPCWLRSIRMFFSTHVRRMYSKPTKSRGELFQLLAKNPDSTNLKENWNVSWSHEQSIVTSLFVWSVDGV